MSTPLRVLLVEDSATDAKLILAEFRRHERTVECERVETRETLLSQLLGRPWDVVISDWSMPKFSALEALRVLYELALDLPFIIVSGTIGEETAAEAMRAGAKDYVLKDKLGRLVPAVDREVLEHLGRIERRKSQAALRASEQRLRQSEEQLRQAQKMEAVGRLAGGVAHDFNNVLSVIMVQSELIIEGLSATDPLRAEIELISNAASRAASLTRQLLLFSRHQVLERKLIDLDQLLLDLEKMLHRMLGEDIAIELSVGNSGGCVQADPSHIEQVILNLAVNARDAMPTGGRLIIETEHVILDETFVSMHVPACLGSHILLAVTDTGCGMDEATQQRIFEPFFTTKTQGTGLGLSTVFGIVQQCGGTILVESEPGKGSIFKVYFPRVDARADDLRVRSPVSVRPGDETVLLVEDDDQVRTVVHRALTRHGYSVLAASNPVDALLVSEQYHGQIDVLLTDIVMPQMSGPELAKRVRAARPGTKTLFMSGYTDDSAVRHGVLDSELAFLQKPVTPLALAKKLREVLDR